MYLIEFSMDDWYNNSWIIEKWHVIIPDPFLRHKLHKLVPFIFYFLWMVPNISRRKGIHKNNMRFFMLPSPKYVANFRLRNRFFRGERWIHTGRKWSPSSAPLAEKLIGGETGRETGWIFLFFCFSDCCTSFLPSIFFTYAFCILHLCILHSSFFLDAFCISEECIM